MIFTIDFPLVTATWPSSWQTRDECPQLSCPSVYIPPECRQTDYTYVNGRRCPACDIDLCQRDSNPGGSADRWSNNNRGNSRDSWDRNRGGSGDRWDSRGNINNRDRWDNNRIGSFDNNRDGNWDSNNRVGSGSNGNNNRGGSWDSNRSGSGSNWDNNRGNRWDSQGRSADRNSQWDSNRSGRNVDTSRSGSVTFERTRGGVSWDNDRNRNRWDNNRGGSIDRSRSTSGSGFDDRRGGSNWDSNRGRTGGASDRWTDNRLTRGSRGDSGRSDMRRGGSRPVGPTDAPAGRWSDRARF